MADRTIGRIKTVAKKIQEFPRNEYTLSNTAEKYDITFKELFIDLDRAISRVIALCNTRNQFKDISSYSQREQILKHLKSISQDIEKGGDFILNLDKLKLDIKEFAYMKYVKTSANDIETEVAKLRTAKTNLLKEKTKLLRAISTVSNNVQKTKDNIEQSSKNKLELEKLETTINNHKEQLKNQDKKHEKYDEKINSFNKEKDQKIIELNQEQENNLEKVQAILEKAKEAMRLGTAAGISAGFQAQYNEIKGIKYTEKDGVEKEKENFRYKAAKFFTGGKVWIWGALLFALIAILIGVWLAQDNDPKLGQIYARLSLMFISLTGAWFCAKQYVNIFNIATDYAYKSTLAKSIDAFSETLKGSDEINENYREYIKKILDEIHKHPLRNYKKQEAVAPIEKIVEAVLDKLPNKKEGEQANGR